METFTWKEKGGGEERVLWIISEEFDVDHDTKFLECEFSARACMPGPVHPKTIFVIHAKCKFLELSHESWVKKLAQCVEHTKESFENINIMK